VDVGVKLVQSTLGAQVLEATATAVGNLFYRSALNVLPGKIPRGGVPVIFPQFAEYGDLGKHGFARNMQWQNTLADSQDKGSALGRTRHTLTINDWDISLWPYHAQIILDTELTSEHFEQTLTVINLGNQEFSWTGGLHPYFFTMDIRSCTLTGLSGVGYHDRYSDQPRLKGSHQLVWCEAPCEKLFAEAPPLQLQANGRILDLSCTGFDQWMIWNPGKEGGRELDDMADDDWQRFVCIEPVCVERPVRLPPGETFTGSLRLGWGAKCL
jgi:glucose-6-phosphate 1-epimerase